MAIFVTFNIRRIFLWHIDYHNLLMARCSTEAASEHAAKKPLASLLRAHKRKPVCRGGSDSTGKKKSLYPKRYKK